MAENRAARGRILLVDDDRNQRRLIAMLFRMAGFQVDTAEDGQVACQRALASKNDGSPYDLILTDIRMPEMDGIEAARRLREEGWSGPIIAMTAYSETGDREACLRAGCDDYLLKPTTWPALWEVVGRHLSSEGGW